MSIDGPGEEEREFLASQQGCSEDAPGRGEAFFRKVLETAADITSVLAPDGRRLFISSGVKAVLGYTEVEALELRVSESTHPDDQALVLGTFRKVLAEPGSGARLRFRQRRKDGSYVPVEATVRNLCEDPDVGGVVVNTRDVTEQLRLEQQFLQAQKLELVGRLAGGVAHDFNNLLTVILSCAELMAERKGRAPVPYVEEITAAAERGRALTRQLLTFARKELVAPAVLDLSAQVKSSEKILRRLLGEDIALELHLEREPWPIRCDPAQLDQVLFNLVVNSRDAMPSGGRIIVETANLPAGGDPGDWVELAVRDFGTGIPDEARAHLFAPFFTTKPTGKGTGLGLATVRRIIEHHGGRIEVQSVLGQGATFRVRFPRNPSVPRPEEGASEASAHGGSERILLVEDDPTVRQLSERALRGAGYQVWTAADARAVARAVDDEGKHFDLLVTDVVLPDGDGIQVAERARARWPRLGVLFSSGYPADRLVVVGASLDFLPKPFTPSVLLHRVRAALDHRPG